MPCRCFNGPQPAVPALTLSQPTYTGGDELLHFAVEDVSSAHRRVVITVAVAGYWLLRVWLTDGEAVTHVETQNPPATSPGAESFFLATDDQGVATVNIEDPNPGQWYVQAAVCGSISTSPPVVLGV